MLIQFGITELWSIRRYVQGLGHRGPQTLQGKLLNSFKQRSYPIIEMDYLCLFWCLAQSLTIVDHTDCFSFEF